MISNYFISFCQANKVKIATLVLSVGLYFVIAVSFMALKGSLPEVVSLPFKKIGVQTIVQKSGKIPERMVGAIFPHSNGPIYPDEVEKLNELAFTQNLDVGLYFWYFSDAYKNVLGVDENGSVFSGLLKQNLEQGIFSLSSQRILITNDFAARNHLSLDDKIYIDKEGFTISGILRSNLGGNIIPADVYMSLADSQNIIAKSLEMQKAYKFTDKNFVNLVALNTNPDWQGNKEMGIKNIDKDLIVYSEKTFSQEVSDQLKIISSFGSFVFISLGLLMFIIFGLMIVYNFKTREGEIAILRMIGWGIKDLKRQFLMEGVALIAVALLIGNGLGMISLVILREQQVVMELPWDISARPHFMPQENAINRKITANLPIHYDPLLFVFVSLGFFLLFLGIYYLSFQRIKHIKPSDYLK